VLLDLVLPADDDDNDVTFDVVTSAELLNSLLLATSIAEHDTITVYVV